MKALGFLVSPLLSVVGGLFKQKKPNLATASPVPTRDDARAEAQKRDELMRRRGGAADIVTGAYGAEAGPGGKTTLGS